MVHGFSEESVDFSVLGFPRTLNKVLLVGERLSITSACLGEVGGGLNYNAETVDALGGGGGPS